jgi:hypothetical protein
MIDRMTHPSQKLDSLTRIQGACKDNLLEKNPVHMVGTRKGEQEPFPPQ